MGIKSLMSTNEAFINELQTHWKVIQLTESEIKDLEWFIQNFDDFFILCEGEKGSAEDFLTCTPASINSHKDKFVLGIYEGKQLIGAIDLIRNYPSVGIWTIGYLLIHPAYQRKRVGYNFIKSLEMSLLKESVNKLRCIVQEQNPNALKFWLKCNFKVVERIQEKHEKSANYAHILEKELLSQ